MWKLLHLVGNDRRPTGKGVSVVGTVRNKRRELPDIESMMENEDLFQSRFFQSDKKVVLQMYKRKKGKIVSLLSSTHDVVQVDDSLKKKSNIIHFYNSTKCGVDNVDQMLRQYSTRCQTRRWPIGVFYNVLDICLLNAWIAFKLVHNSSISRRDFQLALVKDLCPQKSNLHHNPSVNFPLSSQRKRKHCFVIDCNNMTAVLCIQCGASVCGKHSNGDKFSYTHCNTCSF